MWKFIIIVVLTSSKGEVKDVNLIFEGNRDKAIEAYYILKPLNNDTTYIRLDSVNVDLIPD